MYTYIITVNSFYITNNYNSSYTIHTYIYMLVLYRVLCTNTNTNTNTNYNTNAKLKPVDAHC